jgi:hypothetical protein
MEYENVTQNVLLLTELILQNAKQLQHARLLRHVKMPKLPEFDQHLPAKCSVFPLLFGAEHYQSLEIVFTNVG